MKSLESNPQDNSSSTKEDPLPVTKEERYKLLEDLLQQTNLTEEPLVFSLPVKSNSTCWNIILTKQQKDNLIFIAKCGDCSCYHEFPKCDKCKSIRMQSGMCQSCTYIKKEEDYYSSYCGNCFQEHKLPNCVECQHFRLKAGRCTNCGALGPDDIQWIDSCLDTDNNYMRLLYKTFEKRMADQKRNNKQFRTYNNCPLCKAYFHSAKACIFRKHALHFKEMEQQIKQLTLSAKDKAQTAELLLPTQRVNKMKTRILQVKQTLKILQWKMINKFHCLIRS